MTTTELTAELRAPFDYEAGRSYDIAGQEEKALATLLLVVADRLGTPEIKRYEAAIRGNAEEFANL